jgi:hypothetical protein
MTFAFHLLYRDVRMSRAQVLHRDVLMSRARRKRAERHAQERPHPYLLPQREKES